MSGIEDDLKDEIIKGQEDAKSDLSKATELLFNDKWKRRKTKLRARTIPALATLDTIANIYDINWLLDWIDSYTEYITSIDGQGRKDIVDITKFSIERQDKQNERMMDMLGKR